MAATQFDDWTYSPVKNSMDEARAKAAVGAPGRSALEGEFEYYAAGGHALAAIGVSLPTPLPFSAGGITVGTGPYIVVHPSFANSVSDWKARFPTPSAIHISARSSLYIGGGGSITFHSLDLDGSVDIRAVPGAVVTVKKLGVKNAGVEFIPGAEKEVDWKKIRCFTLEKMEVKTFAFNAPGEYVIDE